MGSPFSSGAPPPRAPLVEVIPSQPKCSDRLDLANCAPKPRNRLPEGYLASATPSCKPCMTMGSAGGNGVPRAEAPRTPAEKGRLNDPIPSTPFTPVARPPRTPAWASQQTPGPAPRTAAKQLAAFRKQRDGIAQTLFSRWNKEVFEHQLPSDLPITWNTNLRTTAGLTHYKREICNGSYVHTARIDLSLKVLDSEAKLEATLAHEMCHAGAWLIGKIAKPPHGAAFQKWVGRFRHVRPDLNITTCHSYKIHYAFRWQCTNAACRRIFKRHSNSIDVAKQVCGACKSKLQSLGRFQADGTPARTRAPTPFSLFVKERFGAVKAAATPRTPHGDLMRTLSRQWQLSKATGIEAVAPHDGQAGELQTSFLEAAFAQVHL
ncbi:hypothetical protein WJX84_009911 [Apatococcus fuscideae]|uniref:SprT-like domain-containing protein n=1 Tax=Apatococcus fuscideae TaxID=2026836 RepID=A0AAW1SZL3_9CHLO